jgi:hypothetical protein
MLPLDPKTFLVETLKPYATGAAAGLPGLFERYLLEPGDDEVAIRARMGDVKAIWDKNFEHTRYGELARALSSEHDDASLALQDPGERARLAAELAEQQGEAAERAEAALADWRALLADYVAGGGLTPGSRAALERIAKSSDLDERLVRAELDGAPVAAPPPVMEEGIRRQIQKSLQDLARVVGEERLALSLYHALGLDGVTDDVEEVRRQYDKVNAQNQGRGFGQTATTYKTVLANAKLHLLDGDPRAYVEGLIRDVGAAMELQVARSATDQVIDSTEAESLLQNAMRRGLTDELGRRLISDLAREHGARLEVGAAVDYVACPACNTPHARPSAPNGCKRCGAAIFVDCPVEGCGTRNDATALRCAACQTDLFKFAEATRRLGSLSDAVEDGRVGWAAGELEEISRVLGSGAIPGDLRQRVDGLLAKAERDWTLAEAAIAERRIYAARAVLRGLAASAGDVLGPTGDRPAARAKEVDRRLGEVEKALARARAARGEAREAALVEALGLAEDCDEAINALATIPPQPPGPVRAELGDDGPVVTWSPSTTAGARYLVRRIDADGGVDLSAGTARRYADRDAQMGAVVRYEVTTVRGRARSTAVESEPLLVALEVQGLTVADADREVRLSWQPVPATARVVVRRVAERDGTERDLVAHTGGLVDDDVDNGERYAYRVIVEYGAGADARQTAGVTIYGQPAAPPEGVEELSVASVAGGVQITFGHPPSGVVSIVRCNEEPAVTLGDSLDPATLGSLGVLLAVGADGARDEGSSAVCWYLPVTIAGGLAVAGRSIRHLALAGLANVAAVELPGQVRMTWEWPEGVRVAKVVWRRDRQPAHPDEPGVESAWVRLGEYRDNGGFTIEAGRSASLFAAVLPGIRVDGELIAASSISRDSRVAIRSVEKTDVRYAVRCAGMRRKRLEIDVDVAAGRTPPSLVLVGRSGDLLPRAATEGDVLARLGGDGPLSSKVDLSGRSRPLAVRLFLESASSAAHFQVFDPRVDDLLIR